MTGLVLSFLIFFTLLLIWVIFEDENLSFQKKIYYALFMLTVPPIGAFVYLTKKGENHVQRF